LVAPPARLGDWPIVHPIEVARSKQHMHLMVTHLTTGIVKAVNRLVLAASASSSLSLEPSSARSALSNPVWRRARGVCHPGHQQLLGLGASLAWLQCPDGQVVI
jgi:hypothetical protein